MRSRQDQVAGEALDFVEDAVIVLGADFQFATYNRAAIEFFGPAPSVETFADWETGCGFHVDAPGGNRRGCGPHDLPWRCALRGESLPASRYFILNHYRPAGFWVSARARVSPEDQGAGAWAILAFRAVPVDGQERPEADARGQRNEKMRALGRLAGGLAHDFNNLLTIIAGYGQMMQEALARGAEREKLRAYLSELMNAGRRAVDLTDHLLAFSSRKISRPRQVDLRQRIQELETKIAFALGDAVDLRLDLPTVPCFLQADPALLDQVLLTLASHASQAMPQGGLFTIRLRVPAEFHTEPADGRLELEIADSGNGTDPETLLHIFEPYFRPLSHAEGSGLGLSAVYGIVQQLGGEIGVSSKAGGGTTFRLRFPYPGPALAAPAPGIAPSNSEAPSTVERKTILVVDDDRGVRRLVRTLLENMGFHVLEASGGAGALELLERNRPSIALLLTDVVMPQMSGPQVASTLARQAPELKIIFMSGYTADEIGLESTGEHRPMLLQKPFAPEDLSRRVRQALRAP